MSPSSPATPHMSHINTHAYVALPSPSWEQTGGNVEYSVPANTIWVRVLGSSLTYAGPMSSPFPLFPPLSTNRLFPTIGFPVVYSRLHCNSHNGSFLSPQLICAPKKCCTSTLVVNIVRTLPSACKKIRWMSSTDAAKQY